MPTIADQIRQEGLEKGREEGIEHGLEKGREEGREEGLEKGELMGRIRTLQGILGREISSRETLSTFNLEKLQQLADELTAALKN